MGAKVEQEAQGQPASPEPSVDVMATTLARGMLEQEGVIPAEKPRDETGKFAKKEAPVEAETPTEEAQTEEAPEEAQEETPAEIRKHKLTVKAEDGADLEVEVDDEELKKGYMLEKAFRMKTAQLAREKEAVQARIKEATEPKLKEYEAGLETLKQAVLRLADPEALSADLNKIAESDPATAQKLFFKRLEINQTLQTIAAEQDKVANQRQTEMQEQLRKQAVEAVEVLKTEIPGWSNDLYGKILKFGTEAGFKAEEVNAITDHRAIKVLHDAMKYRELRAKPVVEKRAAPQAPKVVKPGAGEKPDASAESWDKGMAKLKQSGRTDDAVALAKLMLAREAKQQK